MRAVDGSAITEHYLSSCESALFAVVVAMVNSPHPALLFRHPINPMRC